MNPNGLFWDWSFGAHLWGSLRTVWASPSGPSHGSRSQKSSTSIGRGLTSNASSSGPPRGSFRSPSLRYTIQLLAGLIGLGVSGYLDFQHTAHLVGIQVDLALCSSSGLMSCEAVNTSPYSSFLGVGLSRIGVFYFSFVLGLLFFGGPNSRSYRRTQRLISWLALLAVAIDLGLFGIQLGVLGKICLFCLIVYVCQLVLILCAHSEKQDGTFVERLREQLGFSGKKPAKISGGQWFGILLVAGVLSAGTLLVLSFFLPKTTAPPAPISESPSFLDLWKSAPVESLPIRASDGRKGLKTAPVTVVVFSDFECPFCRKAAESLDGLLKAHPKDVQIVFKHFPLDASCNPDVTHRMHVNACSFAKLAYCANEKSRFWDFHDILYKQLEPDALKNSIGDLQKHFTKVFGKPEIESCLKSESALKHVQEDIELGRKVRLSGTPALFMNGKRVIGGFTEENLERLVSIELSSR